MIFQAAAESILHTLRKMLRISPTRAAVIQQTSDQYLRVARTSKMQDAEMHTISDDTKQSNMCSTTTSEKLQTLETTHKSFPYA
jgi:hypothetical protein